jgi:hypothetical protein
MCLGFAVSLCRGESYENAHAKLVAGNPAGLSVTLRLDKNAFFMGERMAGENDSWKLPQLIERYATKRILPNVIAVYQEHEGKVACDFAERFLGYWVKHDPEAGLAALKRAALLREDTGCFQSVLGDVLSRYYSPAGEQLALSFLDDEDSRVVMNVLQLLSRQGSPAIADPLLTHLANMSDDDEPPTHPYGYTNASIKKEILSCLMKRRDWELTEAQKKTLYSLLKTDAHRAWFTQRFSAKPNEQKQ